MDFFTKYSKIVRLNKSYVCIGLDSDSHKIPSFIKKEDDYIFRFNQRIIDQTYSFCAAYKPNFAFYISQGIKGIESLKKTIEYIPKDIPVIIDIKAGDIGNTMEQYSHSIFDYFGADAITINILMGSDVIEACLKTKNSFAFALVLTSNKSANDFFKYHDLYKELSIKVKENSELKLGAVIGATQSADLYHIRKLMPNNILLVPGIGTQGGDLELVCRYLKYSNEDARFLVNSSRGIIFSDSTENFSKVAKEETIKLKNNINEYLN